MPEISAHYKAQYQKDDRLHIHVLVSESIRCHNNLPQPTLKGGNKRLVPYSDKLAVGREKTDKYLQISSVKQVQYPMLHCICKQ